MIGKKFQTVSEGGLSALKKNETSTALLFSAPALILLSLFLITPFVMAFLFSLTSQRLITNPNLPTEFIGFRNYLRLVSDSEFWHSLKNNFIFAGVVVPLQTSAALALAILINRPYKGNRLFRTIFFSPVVTTMIVVSIVWSFLYNPEKGLINEVISKLSFGHLGPFNWLLSPKMAFPAIMILSIWQGVGFQMVIFLAGLQEIPEELYEASRVDGAGPWRCFTSVTLPMLRNTTLFVVIATTILSFKLFTQVWVLTKGGPQGSTMTMIVKLYKEGFQQLKVGYASTIAVVFFLIVLLISMVQHIVMKNAEDIS